MQEKNHHSYKMQVEAIKSGSVIDHIPSRTGFKLLTLFRFTETENRITIGLNLPSKKLKTKDLIKIENTFLSDDQINQLAIYAPKATVNHIQNYKLIIKIFPILPIEIKKILICPNSNCISNNELIDTLFFLKLENIKKQIFFICKYCEKKFIKDILLKNFN